MAPSNNKALWANRVEITYCNSWPRRFKHKQDRITNGWMNNRSIFPAIAGVLPCSCLQTEQRLILSYSVWFHFDSALSLANKHFDISIYDN